jgi:hypothetical protein
VPRAVYTTLVRQDLKGLDRGGPNGAYRGASAHTKGARRPGHVDSSHTESTLSPALRLRDGDKVSRMTNKALPSEALRLTGGGYYIQRYRMTVRLISVYRLEGPNAYRKAQKSWRKLHDRS